MLETAFDLARASRPGMVQATAPSQATRSEAFVPSNRRRSLAPRMPPAMPSVPATYRRVPSRQIEAEAATPPALGLPPRLLGRIAREMKRSEAKSSAARTRTHSFLAASLAASASATSGEKSQAQSLDIRLGRRWWWLSVEPPPRRPSHLAFQSIRHHSTTETAPFDRRRASAWLRERPPWWSAFTEGGDPASEASSEQKCASGMAMVTNQVCWS